MDSELSKRVKEEIVSNYRPDRCGSITEYEPELVFVMPEQPQASLKSLNDSVSSNGKYSQLNVDFNFFEFQLTSTLITFGMLEVACASRLKNGKGSQKCENHLQCSFIQCSANQKRNGIQKEPSTQYS